MALSKLVVTLFAMSLLSFPAAASETTKEASVRDFVQAFYGWYVPASRDARGMHPTDMAIKARGAAFSAPLMAAFKKDLAEKRKAEGEVAGLEFDPFLNSQDPYDRYEVGAVRRKNEHYWVEVFGVQAGKRSAKPDVTPELVYKNGNWIFVNFQYSGTSNLAAILRQLSAGN